MKPKNHRIPQSSPPQSFSVFYDLQKGQYYRVNKTTGKTQPTFKSGQKSPEFDPSVTGAADHRQRKLKAKNKGSLNGSSNHQIKISKSLHVSSSLPQLKQSKKEKRIPNIVENQLNKQESFKSLISSKSKNLNSSSFYQKSLLKCSAEKDHDKNSSSQTKFAFFQKKLNKYSKIEQVKLKRNNISAIENRERFVEQDTQRQQPRKNSFFPTLLDKSELSDASILTKTTSVPSLKNSQTKKFYNQAMKNLQIEEKLCADLVDKKLGKTSVKNIQRRGLIKENVSEHLYQNLLKKGHQNNSKDKNLFLKFHPSYIFKENERLINEQKDRKLNFKKLEQLSIEQNERITTKIYKSIPKQKDENQSQDNGIVPGKLSQLTSNAKY